MKRGYLEVFRSNDSFTLNITKAYALFLDDGNQFVEVIFGMLKIIYQSKSKLSSCWPQFLEKMFHLMIEYCMTATQWGWIRLCLYTMCTMCNPFEAYQISHEKCQGDQKSASRQVVFLTSDQVAAKSAQHFIVQRKRRASYFLFIQ